jgi:bifunctional DNA primase/polymerase-like protein
MSDLRPEHILRWIYWTLGENTVLLVIPFSDDPKHAKKPKSRYWQKTTLRKSRTPHYQRELVDAIARGDLIGALLGRPSGGLATIDLDRDDLIPPFLRFNPWTRETLQTRGARGCQIWVRIRGEYPAVICHGKKEKQVEWRANGQSIVYGIHPNGKPYERINDRLVVTINFSEIKWPPEWGMSFEPVRPPASVVKHDFGPTTPGVLTRRLEKRILAYIAKAEPAIMGQNGENQALKVATALVWGYSLEKRIAWRFMLLWNEKCIPPWNDNDPREGFKLARLERKLDEALRLPHPKSRGYLLEN